MTGARRNDGYDLATGENLWWIGKQGIYPAGSPVLFGDLVIAVAMGGDEPEYPTFDSFREKLDVNQDEILTREEFVKDEEYKDHFGWLDQDSDGRIVRTEWDAKRMESVAERGITASRIGGAGDRTASNLLWRDKKSFSYLITPLVYRDVLYLVKNGGVVTTLDPRTGEIRKAGRTPEAIDQYFASPVAGDGKVFLLSQSGKVTVLKADAAVGDPGGELPGRDRSRRRRRSRAGGSTSAPTRPCTASAWATDAPIDPAHARQAPGAGLTDGRQQAHYRRLFFMATRTAARAQVLSSVAVRLSLRLSLLVLLLLGILPGGLVI